MGASFLFAASCCIRDCLDRASVPVQLHKGLLEQCKLSPSLFNQSNCHLQVGMSIAKLPEGFNPHRGIKKVFDSRQKMVESGEGIDWGFAEALAFGTLVSEGTSCLCRHWAVLL